MAWKLLLPVDLCRPLFYSRDHIFKREDSERHNLGTQYRLAIPSAKSSAIRQEALSTKMKHFLPPRMLIVTPYIYTASGESGTAPNAAAPMGVRRRAPNRPGWWY